MRRRGLIPGVLYGRSKPHAISVPERELRSVLTTSAGLHAILDVVVEGQESTHPSVLKEYQRHPIRGTLIHIDLQEVRLDQPITASVTVTLIGEPAGVKEGGVLSQVSREVNVEALPMEIPEHLDIDVSGMQMGDTLRLSELQVPGQREAAGRPRDDRARDRDDADPRRRGRRGGRGGRRARGRPGRGRDRGDRRGRGRGRHRGCRRRRRPARPRGKPCVSGHGARARRSTCSWSDSGTRAGRTHATGTTPASSSSTSSPGGTAPRWKGKFSGQLAELRLDGHKIALLKPETYMNESGRSVGAAQRFYKLDPDAVLVLHDESDLDLGRLQARMGGGLAGHNGLRSIAQHLKTHDFLRLRIGVGRPDRGDPRPLADFLLSDFEPHEDAEALISHAADAVETLDAEGLDSTQRKYN